jgi:hypothetical protein
MDKFVGDAVATVTRLRTERDACKTEAARLRTERDACRVQLAEIKRKLEVQEKEAHRYWAQTKTLSNNLKVIEQLRENDQLELALFKSAAQPNPSVASVASVASTASPPGGPLMSIKFGGRAKRRPFLNVVPYMRPIHRHRVSTIYY